VELRPLVRAAGAVVRRAGPEGVEVLLVHRPSYDDWTFPKGKAESGESDEETAAREVAEETGLRGTLGVELPSARYRDARGRPKLVRYWTMRPESGEFEPHREVDEIRWFPIGQAGEELSYDRDRVILDAVPPPLLVLRHASAGDSEHWEGDDALRPLDDRGWKQAEALIDQLTPFRIDRIVSSPFVRCVQTVEPLAQARALEVEPRDELAEGTDPGVVMAFIDGLSGEAALICGHGPELDALFGRMKKGETVIVEPADDRLLELGRLPPPG
jgi:8-oxo-(d)GTP phosphatase